MHGMHGMHGLVVLGLLAACKSSPEPITTTPSGPPYLALFEAGRAWSLPIEVASGHLRPTFTVAITTRGRATCTAFDPRRVGDASVARLSCAKPYDDLLIAGTWVATPAGLYHPALPVDGPDDLAMLTDDDLLVNAAPRERQHSHAVETTQEAVETWAFDRAWCARDATTAEPDRRSFTICFEAGGITGGADVVISGPDQVWHRATFGKAPPDLDDPTRGPVEVEP